MIAKSIARTRIEVLKSIRHLLIITGLWLQMYSVEKSKVDTVQRLECVFFASAFTTFYLAKQTICFHGGDVAELYNLFAAFEHSCLKSK